jgi:hypothetical protein
LVSKRANAAKERLSMRKNTVRVFLAFVAIVLAGVLFWSNKGISSAPKTNPQPVPMIHVPSTKSCNRFIAFGDWGAGTSFQKAVAQQLATLYQKVPFDTVLMLGDNIYEIGDVNKLGKAYFTDTYTSLIESGVKFIVALGNHDIAGGFQDDQVHFFKMPGYYYSALRGPFEFFVINSNTFANDEVQQKWLDKALEDSKADWKIVLGHHPVYSSGEHGNNAGLKKTLEPLLVKHSIPLYLAGHDHDYERFSRVNGLQYIVSGGGGAYLRDFPKVLSHSLIRKKAHHFLSFTLDKNILKMQVIDKTGQVIDAAEWTKPETLPKPKRTTGVL